MNTGDKIIINEVEYTLDHHIGTGAHGAQCWTAVTKDNKLAYVDYIANLEPFTMSDQEALTVALTVLLTRRDTLQDKLKKCTVSNNALYKDIYAGIIKDNDDTIEALSKMVGYTHEEE
jgi:hypothetical protein